MTSRARRRWDYLPPWPASPLSIGRYGAWKYSFMEETLLNGKRCADAWLALPPSRAEDGEPASSNETRSPVARHPPACGESVERRRPRKGPIKEVGYVDYGGGSVRYALSGWSWFVKGRRRDALRRMRKNCGRDLEPLVIDEYARTDADASYVGDDLAVSIQLGGEHYKIEPFVHLPMNAVRARAPQ